MAQGRRAAGQDNKMNCKAITVLGLAGILVSFPASRAAEITRHDEIRLFMRQKLVYSQAVLEGLTLEKFDLVSKNALRMRNMSQSNLWFLVNYTSFKEQTTNFQQLLDALFMAATDKKAVESNDAYRRVLDSCVECHQEFRREQRARQKVEGPAKK